MLRISVALIIVTLYSVSTSFICLNDTICFGTATCGNQGTCMCNSPYFGERCQMKNCTSPCLNNKTCDLSTGMCRCAAPMYGDACQFNGTECPAQCLNGGFCNYTNAQCLCPTGYYGNICQNKVCIPSCRNGGVCRSTGDCRCLNGTQGQFCQFREINILRFPVIFGVSIGLIGFCSCFILYMITILLVKCFSLSRKSKRKLYENNHELPGPRTRSSIRTINHVPRLPTVLLDEANVETPPPVPTRNPLVINDYYDSFENLAGSEVRNTETIAYIDPETLSTSPNRTYSVLFDDPYGDETYFANPNTFNRASFQAAIHQYEESHDGKPEIKPKPVILPKPKIMSKLRASEVHGNAHAGVNTVLSKDENIIYEAMEGEDKELYDKYSILSNPDKIDDQCVVLSQDERNSLPRQGENYPRPKSRRQKKKTRYFRENPIYNEPSSSLDKLFDQMSALNFREINPETLIISEHLGMGEFGIVYRGTWISKIGEVPVALKMLKEKTDENKKIVLFQEATIMGQFSHPNILRILGIVSNKEPFSIVSELMKMGMLDFLHMVRNSELDLNKFPPLLLRFCREIAAGMQYLASKKFVHRDLAARNILIANNYTCRIADFGMAREIINNSDYYSSTGGNIPIRWTAPEALFHQIYSEKSDVWSFGMTIFEIWSFGLNPWYNLSNEEVIRAIHSKCVHHPPAGCPRDIYFVMVEALKYDPKKRCIFTQFRQMLEAPIVLRRPETGSEADLLGNDPEFAKDLYVDLQTKYS